jgi:transcriptional regulator with XRE-family HTH domain
VVGLAAAAVVSKSTLYRIESGGRMPMKKTVLKLSQALGIDPGALFRPDGLRLISSDREPWGHQQRLKHEWTLFPWIRAASK